MENTYQKNLLLTIGKTIKNFRVQKEMSQTQLAKGICTKVTICHIETGQQKIPNIIMLNKIAKKLDVTLSYILEVSENELNDFSQKIKRKIINLIGYGKCLEAERVFEKNLKIKESAENYKYWCFIQGTICFYDEEYILAKEYFLQGLNYFQKVTSKTILSYIEIFLANGFFASHFRLFLNKQIYINEVYTNRNLKFAYILKNSIEYYLYLDPKNILRLKIYLFDFFRLFTVYDVCEELLKEIESVIEEYAFYDSKIDLTLALILYYTQINKKHLIKESIENTRLILKAYNLTELEIYLDKKLNEVNNAPIHNKQPV